MTSYRSGGRGSSFTADQEAGLLANSPGVANPAQTLGQMANVPSSGEKTHLTAITTEGVTHPAPRYSGKHEYSWRAKTIKADEVYHDIGAFGTSTATYVIDGNQIALKITADPAGGAGKWIQVTFDSPDTAATHCTGIWKTSQSPELAFNQKLDDIDDADSFYWYGFCGYDAGSLDDAIMIEAQPAASAYYRLHLRKSGASVYTSTTVSLAEGAYLWWKIVATPASVLVYTSTDADTWTLRLTYSTAANIPTAAMGLMAGAQNTPGGGAAILYTTQLSAKQTA